MPTIALITAIILIIFLIFTEIITVNLRISDKAEIDVNFMIFAISFKKPPKNNNTAKKSKRKVKLPIGAYLKLLFSVLRTSEIILRRASVDVSSSDPFIGVLNQGLYSTILGAAISYAEANSKKFTFDNIKYTDTEHNNIKLDAGIVIPMRELIVSFVPFLYELLSAYTKNMRGRLKNGRKQNE